MGGPRGAETGIALLLFVFDGESLDGWRLDLRAASIKVCSWHVTNRKLMFAAVPFLMDLWAAQLNNRKHVEIFLVAECEVSGLLRHAGWTPLEGR